MLLRFNPTIRVAVRKSDAARGGHLARATTRLIVVRICRTRTLVTTMLNAGDDLRDVQIAARHAGPEDHDAVRQGY